MLQDRTWRLKYTPEDGDLTRLFHVPVLEEAERYDRLTGYFSANALTLAARGIEGLVRHDGRMRLVVGCTLNQPEIEAIEKGEQLRSLVDRHLTSLPLAPPDPTSADALELLAWMVGQGFLEVKVAVPCSEMGTPIPESGIFHEKTGIIEDRVGDRLAWTGSLNETSAGWQSNWESISVYTSWGAEPERVDHEEASFAKIWAGKAHRLIVLDVPAAARRELFRFMPTTDMPKRLQEQKPTISCQEQHTLELVSPSLPIKDLRARVWRFIRDAPSLPCGGNRVGEATAAVEPWPHQMKAFERMYGNWPPRLLIADEVGLGKTIQAGLLLRQAWLARRAKRILILAPKAVLRQWQIELREKFNLNWPIYDGGKLTYYPSPALCGQHERDVGPEDWHREPVVIVSSQLMRRSERAVELLERAEPWDLIILDEAHHARRRGAGGHREGGPNTLLKLMRGLKDKAQGLLLLTATPMQVAPVEVWDLLNLLGLPVEWTSSAFLDFFSDIERVNPSNQSMERMAALFRSAERAYGKNDMRSAERITGLSRWKVNKVLRALRQDASIPRRHLETEERQAAITIMRVNSPIRSLVSRNTRELLRKYFESGMLTTPIAERDVDDRFLEMTNEEREIYDAVDEYISNTYNRASDKERMAVGFVMTIYRRRLSSSFRALRETLCKHLDALTADQEMAQFGLEEDLSDDEAVDVIDEIEEAAKLENDALIEEQKAEIDNLLKGIDRLEPDSKLGSLKDILRELHRAGHGQMMVFTQYTDTMDFLRQTLLEDDEWELLCFSGRGGEVAEKNGIWRRISRDDAKRRFRDGEADILLCTDAAAEGLNFQFCGALINYDMPWNPMRVEQRIGRIDRLGQKNATIRIINLHYEGTVETDIYRALRERIGLFESVVGRLQPILSRLPSVISESVLTGKGQNPNERANVVGTIEREADSYQREGFDIDVVTDTDFAMPESPKSLITMDDLDRIIGSGNLMAPGVDIRPMGHREYALSVPGTDESLRVTTDLGYFEEHADSMELWSPGNPLFVPPEFIGSMEPNSDISITTLKDLLDSG